MDLSYLLKLKLQAAMWGQAANNMKRVRFVAMPTSHWSSMGQLCEQRKDQNFVTTQNINRSGGQNFTTFSLSGSIGCNRHSDPIMEKKMRKKNKKRKRRRKQKKPCKNYAVPSRHSRLAPNDGSSLFGLHRSHINSFFIRNGAMFREYSRCCSRVSRIFWNRRIF